MKGDKKFETKASRLVASSEPSAETSYEVEIVEQVRGKITVSGEEAAKLVGAVREEAKRLSAMIYLLSNITVKDEKTQEEYVIMDKAGRVQIPREMLQQMGLSDNRVQVEYHEGRVILSCPKEKET